MVISLLALEGVFDTGLSALLDVLATADGLARAERRSPGFTVGVYGLRRRVQTQLGLRVPVQPASRLPRSDVVIVPALGCKTPATLEAALGSRQVAEAGALLRSCAARGALVGAACTGTFVVAEAGLLDGERATTTWWLAPLFRARYPKVELDDSRMVVRSSRRVTAGAALAHLDLALWLLRRRSPTLASLTARYLVVEPRTSQALYAIPDQLAHDDEVVQRFESWARRHLAQPFSLPAAAQAVGASSRTLARRLERVLGRSPLSYVQDLRVERAVHLLQTGDQGVEEIAGQVGYRDGATLRTLLKRKTGRGVRELRARG
jgi:transcriptional regulator GlxA family with amidase domain